MLTIANVNQDIETTLKQDKSEGAMPPPPPPPSPIVATLVSGTNATLTACLLQNTDCSSPYNIAYWTLISIAEVKVYSLSIEHYGTLNRNIDFHNIIDFL